MINIAKIVSKNTYKKVKTKFNQINSQFSIFQSQLLY